MSQRVYIVRIQGVSGESGSTNRLAFCTPVLPAYADADDYVLALTDRPTGGGSEWKPLELSSTVGGFTVLLHRRAGKGPSLDVLDPQPIGQLLTDVAAGSAAYVLDLGTTVSDEDRLYVEAELAPVVSILANVAQVSRGAADTTAAAHPGGARVYAVPPSMVGRIVEVSVVDRNAASAASETIVRRGYIHAPQQHSGHSLTIQCDADAGEAKLERHPEGHVVYVARSRVIEGGIVVNPPGFFDGAEVAPRYASTGAYWHIPEYDIVVRGDYDGTSWIMRRRLVAGDPGSVPFDEPGDVLPRVLAYEVLYTGGDLNPCGYDDSGDVPSRNPAYVALNVWISTAAGTNHAGSGRNYDRGSTMAPHVAVGWPYQLVDIDAFEELAEGLLAGAEAELWLGGSVRETVHELMRRLLGPYGIAVIITPAGVVRPVWQRDVVYSESTPNLKSYLIESSAGEWTQGVVERPLDSISIIPEIAPGLSDGPIDNFETGGESYYESGPVLVGGALEIDRAAVRSDQARLPGSAVARAITTLLRRGALRWVQAELVCTRRAGETFAPGDEFAIPGPIPVLTNPQTGLDLSSGEALVGLITKVDPLSDRTPVSAIITGVSSTRLAKHTASATVSSYDSGTMVLTVESADWGDTDDALDFAATYVVELRSPSGKLRSTVSPAVVDAVASASITLVDHFADDLGDMDGTSGRRAPRNGDLVVFALYDEVVDDQRDDDAYLAARTSTFAPPTLPDADGDGSNDLPYLYAL